MLLSDDTKLENRKDVFEPTIVYNDNQITIVYVKDLKYHGRTKHIDIMNNFIGDNYCIKRGDLEIFTCM